MVRCHDVISSEMLKDPHMPKVYQARIIHSELYTIMMIRPRKAAVGKNKKR